MPGLRAVSLVAVALAIACPATASADEVWVPPEGGGVSAEIAAEGGRLVYAFPANGFAVDGDHIYYGSVDYDPSTGSYGGSALARVTPVPPVFE